MDLRKELISLLKSVPTRDGGYCDLEDVADYLIANGVVIHGAITCKGCKCYDACSIKEAGNFGDNGFCSNGKQKEE